MFRGCGVEKIQAEEKPGAIQLDNVAEPNKEKIHAARIKADLDLAHNAFSHIPVYAENDAYASNATLTVAQYAKAGGITFPHSILIISGLICYFYPFVSLANSSAQ